MKMTVGQAIVKFLDNQYIELDGVQNKFVDCVFTIFGHGIVVGLGQALDEDPGSLRVYQGRAFYDGTGDLEREELARLSKKYGLIVL